LSPWTPQRVLDAATAMEWQPDGAIEVRTDDYRLIRYPDWALDPTFPAAQVTRSRSDRSVGDLVDEVLAHVRSWGLLGVAWWVSAASWPQDTEEQLRVLGGKRIDIVQILARELTGLTASPPDLGVPADVSVELVDDEAAFRAASQVTVRGWGRKEPDEASLATDLAKALSDLVTWTSFRVLASVGGAPACTAGATLNDEVAQLWGAVTLPAFRRRGSYRAVLAERLRLARDHGAELALVKGRAETSGPILLRAGFTDYGEERCYWLPREEFRRPPVVP
jgi:GNAT superfamily N-acetyltransferase